MIINQVGGGSNGANGCFLTRGYGTNGCVVFSDSGITTQTYSRGYNTTVRSSESTKNATFNSLVASNEPYGTIVDEFPGQLLVSTVSSKPTTYFITSGFTYTENSYSATTVRLLQDVVTGNSTSNKINGYAVRNFHAKSKIWIKSSGFSSGLKLYFDNSTAQSTLSSEGLNVTVEFDYIDGVISNVVCNILNSVNIYISTGTEIKCEIYELTPL